MVARTHSCCSQSDKLEELFAEWEKSYPATEQARFNKDGILHEELYRREATRLLFVVREPNNMDNRYGTDLRILWGDIGLGKPFDLNLARWTTILLDGATEYLYPDAAHAKQQLRRVAIVNLKKLAGGGKANDKANKKYAQRDKEYFRRQVAIIQPTLVVTCGCGQNLTTNRLFSEIISDDPLKFSEDSIWTCGSFQVLPANHPSIRPKDSRSAFDKVVERASQAKVGAFGTK